MEPEHPNVPIVRQCKLLDLARASFYYEPEGETELNLMLMRIIDRELLRRAADDGLAAAGSLTTSSSSGCGAP